MVIESKINDSRGVSVRSSISDRRFMTIKNGVIKYRAIENGRRLMGFKRVRGFAEQVVGELK